jgi:ribonuclease P protein component
MSKQFTLGKKERLKSRKQIEILFAERKSFVVAPFRIYFMVNGEASMVNERNWLQFGVGVSAKNFKRAVDRNRVKRLTREAWRLQKNELSEKTKSTQKQLNVFFIYTGKELPDFTIVKDKVAVALKKLVDKIDENISSHP